jgi:large conductance mechanosensitive channel
MLNEFKKFISRGNVMDMAVGIIIGAAFTAIVQSMVGDLLNPFISLFTGGIDFSGLYVVLGSGDYASLAEAEEAGVVFMLVKGVNSLKKMEEAPAPAPKGPSEVELLQEIRDLLAKK